MSCSICLEDSRQKEFYVTTCNHVFHKSCILKVNNIYKINDKNDKVQFEYKKCPICRNELYIQTITIKNYSCNILKHDLYLLIKIIYDKIKYFNLNKNYVCISGLFADNLYKYLTCILNNTASSLSTTLSLYENKIDLYYLDYDNLYPADISIPFYKKNTNLRKLVKTREIFNIIYLKNIDPLYIKNFERCIFDIFKLENTSNIAFIIHDSYITFYIHNDYYK
jgi:hypothetical protein